MALAEASGDDGDRGIETELTKSVFRINEMNRMGMIVDLSHISKNVMIDVLGASLENGWNGSLAPPIFSHSSAYDTLVTFRTKSRTKFRTTFFGLSRSTGH